MREKNEMPKDELEQEPPAPETPGAAAPDAGTDVPDPLLEELETLKNSLADQEDKFLRLAAEYDNYRRRSQKEKESAWADSKAETAAAFLPVYDNLERALKQETSDEAYKKGVEMTMAQLREVLSKLGIEEIPALGEAFDPNLHNAVLGEGHHGRGGAVALRVGDDNGLAALHDGDAGVGRTEIDTDDFRHNSVPPIFIRVLF